LIYWIPYYFYSFHCQFFSYDQTYGGTIAVNNDYWGQDDMSSVKAAKVSDIPQAIARHEDAPNYEIVGEGNDSTIMTVR
jgi:hypothetical protein